jgi:hypothetical protein
MFYREIDGSERSEGKVWLYNTMTLIVGKREAGFISRE